MLTSTNNNNYTSIDEPIKTDSSSKSCEPRLYRKDLCIYLIGIITGSLLIMFLFDKQIGLDYIYNNNNNHQLNVESAVAVSPHELAATTNVLFDDLLVDNIVKFSLRDSSWIIRNPSGSSNKLKPVKNDDSNYVKWKVGYDSTRKAYSFENVAQGCYMQHAGGYLKCLSGLKDKSYWKGNSKTYEADGIKYQQLKNYNSNEYPCLSKKRTAFDMSKTCWGAVDILRYDDDQLIN